MSRGRLLAVAAALLAPIVVIALHDMSSARSVTTVLCLVLAVAAIMRLAGAMKEQAALGFRLTHQANHDDLTGLPNRSSSSSTSTRCSVTRGEPVGRLR